MDDSSQTSFQKLFCMRLSLVAVLEKLHVSREEQLYDLDSLHKVAEFPRNQRTVGLVHSHTTAQL
jgi:hypothetical protein